MKYLSLLLVVSAFAVAQPEISGEFGGQGYFPGTDDILDTYTYGSSVLGTIPASFGDYRTVDEFVATQNANLTKFTYWGLSTTTNPSSLNLMCFANNAGVPSSTPTFETSYPVTVVNSGFTFGSYTVYYAQMTVSLSIVAGTQWWGFQRPGADTWYVGVGSVVEGYEAYRTLGAGYFDEPSLSTYRAAWLRTEASIVMGDRIAADTFDGISQTDIYFCFSHNDMSTFPPA